MELKQILQEIDNLRIRIKQAEMPTNTLLKLVSNFRLDWGEDDSKFSNNFDFGVTKPILFSGLTNEKYKIKAGALVDNNPTSKFLVEKFLHKQKINKDDLLYLYKKIIDQDAGWRTHDVSIGYSEQFFLPSFASIEEIDTLIDSLLEWYNSKIESTETHILIVSGMFHYELVQIHPFADGNGRFARIISSMILLSKGIPPPRVKMEDRREYLACLRTADAGQIEPFINFIGTRVIDSLNDVLENKY